jgi:hypothetical protein
MVNESEFHQGLQPVDAIGCSAPKFRREHTPEGHQASLRSGVAKAATRWLSVMAQRARRPSLSGGRCRPNCNSQI